MHNCQKSFVWHGMRKLGLQAVGDAGVGMGGKPTYENGGGGWYD